MASLVVWRISRLCESWPSAMLDAGLRPALFLMSKVLCVCELAWVCSCHLMPSDAPDYKGSHEMTRADPDKITDTEDLAH